MKRLLLLIVTALPLFAEETLFSKYEAARQGFLTNSLGSVQKAAKEMAAIATAEKKAEASRLAVAVAKSPDMARARENFSLLSDEMIKVRNAATGARPAVYSCPMYKKSWLQPKGTVGNPYDAMMALCGKLEAE
jgi:hypothetical protein